MRYHIWTCSTASCDVTIILKISKSLADRHLDQRACDLPRPYQERGTVCIPQRMQIGPFADPVQPATHATALLTTKTSPSAQSPSFRPLQTFRQDDQASHVTTSSTTASTERQACSISRSNLQPKNQAPPPSRCTTTAAPTFTNSTHTLSEQRT